MTSDAIERVTRAICGIDNPRILPDCCGKCWAMRRRGANAVRELLAMLDEACPPFRMPGRDTPGGVAATLDEADGVCLHEGIGPDLAPLIALLRRLRAEAGLEA